MHNLGINQMAHWKPTLQRKVSSLSYALEKILFIKIAQNFISVLPFEAMNWLFIFSCF